MPYKKHIGRKFKKLHLAVSGTRIHEDLYKQFREQSLNQGSVELKMRKDFVRSRDKGFSVNRAIRDIYGKAIRVWDSKYKRKMMSMPDFVDYKNDIIIDLKIKIFRPQSPPYITEFERFRHGAPNGIIKEDLESAVNKQYHSQFERYNRAYMKATGRNATLHVYIVPYIKIGH